MPRIGENITVPFLRAKVGTDSFYVQDIRHQFFGSTHLIDIDLKGGYFNSYYYFRKHEGMEKGEIGFGIGHKYYEWEVKEMLGLRR